MIEGRLRLILGGKDLILVAGGAAEFDTRLPHWTGSANGEPVEYLWRAAVETASATNDQAMTQVSGSAADESRAVPLSHEPLPENTE